MSSAAPELLSPERQASMKIVRDNNARIPSELLSERILIEMQAPKLADGPMTAAPARQEAPAANRLKAKLRGLTRWVADAIRHIPVVRDIARWGWSVLKAPRTARMAFEASVQVQEVRHQLAERSAALEQRREQQEQRQEQLQAQLQEQVLQHANELHRQAMAQIDGLRGTITALQGDKAALTRQLSETRREIMFQQRRLSLLASDAAGPALAPAQAAAISDQRLDSLYVAFEDVFRGAREDIKQRLVPYVEKIVLAGAGSPARPILDVGCGRGEFLELLKDNHLSAYGIDINSIMVERSVALGLDARCVDLLTHLKSVGDGTLGAVAAFHVVEHLPFDVLIAFLDEALRVIAPGGLLILETPNPETVRVGASTFYNDPTHRNPIMPEPLRFMVEQRGFTEAEIIRLHPYGPADLLQGNEPNIRYLNRILFGPQDYAIIARTL